MAGDSRESPIITKDAETMYEFSWAHVEPMGGGWASRDHTSEGWPVGADTQGATGCGMGYRDSHRGVPEGSPSRFCLLGN